MNRNLATLLGTAKSFGQLASIGNADWMLKDLRIGQLLETPPPSCDWLVSNLLPKGVMGILFGEGSGKKTYGLMQLFFLFAVADLVEKPLWLGEWKVVKPRRCLYIFAEDMKSEFHFRIKELLDEFLNQNTKISTHEIKHALDDRFLMLSRELFFSNDSGPLFDQLGQPTEKYQKLRTLFRGIGPLDVVAIDTLSIVSETPENDNNLQAQLVKHLGFLRDEFGFTIIVLHHTNKGSRGGDGGNASGALRGASALYDNCRWAMWFKPIAGSIDFIEAEPVRVQRVRKPAKIVCSTLEQWPWFKKIDYNKNAVSENAQKKHLNVLVEWVEAHPGLSGYSIIKAPELRSLGGANKIGDLLRCAISKGLIQREGIGKNTRHFVG